MANWASLNVGKVARAWWHFRKVCSTPPSLAHQCLYQESVIEHHNKLHGCLSLMQVAFTGVGLGDVSVLGSAVWFWCSGGAATAAAAAAAAVTVLLLLLQQQPQQQQQQQHKQQQQQQQRQQQQQQQQYQQC